METTMHVMHRILMTAGICALGIAGFASVPARADGYDYDRYDYSSDCGSYCYGRDHDDDRYRDWGYYDGDRADEGYRPSRYRDYDGGYRHHTVCDSDGDRCYRTRSWHWNYCEYLRRVGDADIDGYRGY
jgi:hypothetical protein